MHRPGNVLAAALLILTATGVRSPAQVAPATNPPPATRDAAIPVREVVLFSSGVGYFEHFGAITGNGSTELRFKTDQINDVLKSLLLQDLDGGKVATVSYDSQAPLAHRLKGFQVDITVNPSMADLLNQLRGATITLAASFSKDPISGTILGVEQKPGPDDRPQTPPQAYLNLKSGKKLMSVRLADVRDLELQDPKLQSDLDSALAAVAQARDQEKKPVTVQFAGQGERRVRLGYVVETPVWKTSYRLVLGQPEARPAAAPTSRQSRAFARLQGWAIVENQTDNDWKDIQLSLVSGRPLSFIEDLYHSRYVPRPVVESQNKTSPEPQTYEGGVTQRDIDRLARARNAAPQNANSQGLFGGSGGGAGPMDATASIVAAASGASVGELFQYSIANVSIDRQKSAMIPIVTDNVEVEKLSIYNADVLATHPLTGALVKNTTGKHLLAGPVTVLDAAIYAGDARLDDVPPGQTRLISYGIDQQVFVDKSDAQAHEEVLTGKLVKGVMTLSAKSISQQPYLLNNKSDHEKVLIIEQPREENYQLTSPPQAQEQTPTHFRFRVPVPANSAVKFSVMTESIQARETALSTVNNDSLELFIKERQIPQNVRDALDKVMKLKLQIDQLSGQEGRRQKNIAAITSEQTRLRENMKTVSPETDYYKRLLKKLDEQETEIETIQKQINDLQTQSESVKKELQDYISELSIG